jgi:hypothetical protein
VAADDDLEVGRLVVGVGVAVGQHDVGQAADDRDRLAERVEVVVELLVADRDLVAALLAQPVEVERRRRSRGRG